MATETCKERCGSIDDWELVTTTWQQTIIDQTIHTHLATHACIGRFVWTWKAIYKGASK